MAAGPLGTVAGVAMAAARRQASVALTQRNADIAPARVADGIPGNFDDYGARRQIDR